MCRVCSRESFEIKAIEMLMWLFMKFLNVLMSSLFENNARYVPFYCSIKQKTTHFV